MSVCKWSTNWLTTQMIDISNTGKIKTLFEGWSKKYRKSAKVRIEFTAPYAAVIHEDLNRFHPNGQAKFLETPLRLYQRDMQDILERNLRNKEGIEVAMRRMCEFALDRAKELVPLQTGFLRDSGRVVVEDSSNSPAGVP